jgi:hypothetical protein
MDLPNIAREFKIDGVIAEVREYGTGHIHSTYKVTTIENSSPDYILQRINHRIFPDVEELTQNIIRITGHIRSVLKSRHTDEIEKRVVEVIRTHGQKGFYKDKSQGDYWRVFKLIKGAKTVDVLENKHQAKAMGRALGEFQGLMLDLPLPRLSDTIPDFHNTTFRIDKLKNSIYEDPLGRYSEVRNETDYLFGFEKEMKSFLKNTEGGVIPIRYVHQDVKLSNVLFDENHEILCLIDLDTVMSGYFFYDFGDAIRGSMNTGAEDEEDITKVSLKLDLFKAFATGYIQASKSFITWNEVETLVFGAKIMTYEQAIRFMDDYLNGDIYYKVNHPEHNLIRAKSQIAYFKDILRHFN